MIPAKFDYARPEDLDEALRLLSTEGAMLLAGGQTLVPMLSTKSVRPALLVDISRLSALRQVTVRDDHLVIGAAATMTMIATSAATAAMPLLTEVLLSVASASIRNRGTLVGNLISASPNSELPVLILALGASFVLRKADGQRIVAADEFFLGPHRTAVGCDEIVTEIQFPLRTGTKRAGAFREVSARAGAPPLCCVAADLDIAADTISAARIAVGGIVERPIRCTEAEQAVVGRPLKAALLELSGLKLTQHPSSEMPHSSYAVDVAKVLIGRAVGAAFAKVTRTYKEGLS